MVEVPKKKRRTKKAESTETDKVEAAPKRKRRTKFEIQAEKLEKELLKATKATKDTLPSAAADVQPEPLEVGSSADSKSSSNKLEEAKPEQMYTLKFNSPILPYAKFPLTQNKYIQDFLRSYEQDQNKIERVIGVHFEKNNNSNAKGAVGIEIEIIKKNNITIIESNSNKRYKVIDYDPNSNFSTAVPY